MSKKMSNCKKKIGLLTFDCKYCNGIFVVPVEI